MKQKAPPPRRKRRATPSNETRSSDGAETLGNRYVLGQPLGAGAVAEVVAGEDTRLERPVAVKLLRPDLADQPDARERFEAEARAAAGLAHPNIVQVFDVEVEQGRPYLVMERLPGRTLADEIARGEMDPARVIEVGKQVLAALGAAHSAGIVHRDVKPGNVLLAADGTWKVADFGIAKSMESADALTSPGIVLCTPGYVAPERLDGEPATPSSDLYSVGVLLYEALSGRRPFAADTPLGVARLAQTEEAPPLDSLRPGLDSRLVALVHRALSRDPSQRFSSALEMRDELIHLHDVGAPGLHEDPTTPIRAPEPVRDVGSNTAAVPTGFTPARSVRSGLVPTVLIWVVLGVMGAVLAVVLLTGGSDDGGTPAVTPTTSPAIGVQPPLGPEVPEPLADAIERLEEAVQP